MTIELKDFNHVSRQTRKLDETRRFYVDVLGFRVISRPPFSFRGAWLYGAGIQIHLIEEPYDSSPEPINTRDNHIAFGVANVDAAEEILKQRGVVYKRSVVPERNTDQVFFRDPDGWLIELGKYKNAIDR
jgi:catechol 2,3-dioxygenase-like lactoylglutathione lyase family enzyme